MPEEKTERETIKEGSSSGKDEKEIVQKVENEEHKGRSKAKHRDRSGANRAETEAKQESKQESKQGDQQIAATKKLDELETKIKELQEENSSLKDQYLRKQADFDNFRKRMFKEKDEAIRFANTNLILDLVGIIDDFERAINSGEESQDFEKFHSGVVLIEKQFVSMLEKKWGLNRFESKDMEFNPEKHEAINMEESANHNSATVVEDYQRGYMLHDRVIRHAKVKVAMPKNGGESPDAHAEGEEEQPEAEA